MLTAEDQTSNAVVWQADLGIETRRAAVTVQEPCRRRVSVVV